MNKLATQTRMTAQTIETVLIGGDLSKLTPEQRVSYYRNVCESVGLNPLTKPFEYINLNGKLTLYARKDATDQLRSLNGVSIERPEIKIEDGFIIVTVSGYDTSGRKDADVGVVKETDMRGDKANAIMKAVTKAKRRLTLSLCGLGWLDETEVETIPDAEPVVVTEAGTIEPEPVKESDVIFAENELNSKGVRYGDIDIETLSYMANSITKAMKDNGHDEEKMAEYARKLDAIKIILAYRNI